MVSSARVQRNHVRVTMRTLLLPLGIIGVMVSSSFVIPPLDRVIKIRVG
jgi:hypothetical protein